MGIQSQERALENLRKQLGVAVRSVQWSYAIFWSSSPTQPGVLEWCEGYYNGDIKTRKTVLAEDVNADKLSLRRSEQLKDLYESLQEGESDLDSTSNKRPCASLSPEDLSDLEWYYLVCMSFVFTPGQGLPGRALASGRSMWLCNAQDADSKLFIRSLLAKSASIETVICFPHMEGVIELGITDMVPEDPNLVQHIRTSLLEFNKPVCSDKSSTQHNTDYDKNGTGTTVVDEEMVKELHGATMFEDLNNSLEDNCCDMCQNNNNQVDENEIELDDLSQCIDDSTDSSGCISQAFQVLNPTRFGLLGVGNEHDDEDLHYKKIIGVILERPSRWSINAQLCVGSCSHGSSSFVPWKREGRVERESSKRHRQRDLKKVLLTVPLMIARTAGVTVGKEKQEIEKTSMLNKTMKELEARVEELECCINVSREEQSCDNNYEQHKKFKRKACEIEDELSELKVNVRGEEVVIEMRCCWREYLLVDIMEAVNNLNLDAYTVQSWTVDGILNLKLNSKFRGAAGSISAGMIKQALRRTVGLL